MCVMSDTVICSHLRSQMLHVVTSFVSANSTSFGMMAYGFEISDLSKAFDSIDMINQTTLSLSTFK